MQLMYSSEAPHQHGIPSVAGLPMQYYHIIFPLIYLAYVKSASIDTRKENDKKIPKESHQDIESKLATLQKEEERLLMKINSAIDDTVQVLKKANDSEAMTGLQHMEDLKREFVAIQHEKNKEIHLPLIVELEGRRHNDGDIRKPGQINKRDKKKQADKTGDKPKDKHKPIKYKPEERYSSDSEEPKKEKKEWKRAHNLHENKVLRQAEAAKGKKAQPIQMTTALDKIFKPDTILAKESQSAFENRYLVQKKLDKWIKARELEKEKLKEYKIKKRIMKARGILEKCPRYGMLYFRKRKPLMRRSIIGKRRVTYACCRKCCKQSYLGCL